MSSKKTALLKKILTTVALLAGLGLILNAGEYLGAHFAGAPGTEPLSYALLFVAGTLTSLHCAGMCGSLVVGYTVQSAQQGKPGYGIHIQYALGKTISYTVLGALAGLIGSGLSITPDARATIGIVSGLLLLAFGLSTLGLLPQKYLSRLRPPAMFMRWLGSSLQRHRTPFLIGIFNGLMIICGPLQSMYIMAAGTGSPTEGALMLLSFGLGTLPMMMGFGMLTGSLSRQMAPRLIKLSGIIVFLLGGLMIQRGYYIIQHGMSAHDPAAHMNMHGQTHESPPSSASMLQDIMKKSEAAMEELARYLHP
ncbi:MAG: hypothetical protein RIQ52_1970 [Pseudomonadota bacterium]|jgi:sulfite exporter TauE/SafE